MNHLANVGPLSVAVAASSWSFYGGGVFDGCDYDKNIEINHAVQLVGYGTDASQGDYWIIRNSWGPNWGENGFMRLKSPYIFILLPSQCNAEVHCAGWLCFNLDITARAVVIL